jgi:hypothetical protein
MAGSVYWDEWSQRWMMDDSGRPRQATPEEVDAYLEALDGGHQESVPGASDEMEAYLADLSDQVWGPKVQHG